MSISSRNSRLFIATQFLYALSFMIPIWIVFYQGRISIPQISFIVALQYAIQLIFELPTGALADIVGRKACTILGYFLWALSSLLILISPGFLTIAIATVLAGIAESFLSGSLEALLFDSYKQDGNIDGFSSTMATSGMWFQVGLAAATIIGALSYQLWDGLPYLLYAIACGIAGLLSFSFIEPTIDSEHFSLQSYLSQMRLGVIEAFRSKAVALMSLFYIAVSGITWSNNLYFFDFMLLDLGFSTTQRGIIGAVIRIFNVSVLRMLLKNERLFTRTRSIIFFPAMMILCFLPGVFFSGWAALPFIAGAVMAGTARWIILTRYTNELFTSKYRATAISVLSMFTGLVFIAITWTSGPIIEMYSVKMMYTLLGILSVVIIIPLAFMLVRNHTSPFHR